jgi:hypothetical protein
VLRFDRIAYQGSRRADGVSDGWAPERFTLVGTREADTVRLMVRVEHALATEMSAASFRRIFLQMRGEFRLRGKVMGAELADSGKGFFETYVRPGDRLQSQSY